MLVCADFGVDVVEQLSATERLLDDAARSGYPPIDEVTNTASASTGREFRVLLVLLAAKYGPRAANREYAVRTAAVVCELNHLATVHHDLITGSDAGCGRDNWVEILAGDHLFTTSARLATGLGIRAVEIQARTSTRLVTAQVQGLLGTGSDSEVLTHYLSVITGRTGALTATCAALGALAGGAGEQLVEAMLAFGEHVGVAQRLLVDLSALLPGAPQPAHFYDRSALLLGTACARGEDATARLRQEFARLIECARQRLDGTPDSAARRELHRLVDSLVTEFVRQQYHLADQSY